jgi:YD repeat-containing protein
VGGLKLKRTYHSTQQIQTNSSLGSGWYGTYNRRLSFNLYASLTAAVRGAGYVEPVRMRPYSTNYVPYSGHGFTIDPDDEDGYILRTKSGQTEYYDSQGALQRIIGTDSIETTLEYDGDARLSLVSDSFGNSLAFAYDETTGNLAAVTDQAGRIVSYDYDASNNLVRVTYPDQTTRRYHYEDLRFPNHLTGVTDQNGNRYATYAYDEKGRAILSEHSDGAGRVTLAYNRDGTTTVTDSLGEVKVYTFNANDPGIRKPTQVTSEGNSESYEYYSPAWNNPQLRIMRQINANGNQTSYTYDTNNLTVKILADGTPEAQQIEYTYDPRFLSKVQTVTEPSVSPGKQKVTTYSYDDLGNHTAVTINGYRPDGTPVTRTTAYQFRGRVGCSTRIKFLNHSTSSFMMATHEFC